MIKKILRAVKNPKTVLSLIKGKTEKPNYTADNVEAIRKSYAFDKLRDSAYHHDVLKHPEKYIIKHLEEIVSIGYNLPFYLKYAQLALYINHFKIKTLVETGTAGGDCCDFFKETLSKIYTIDIDPRCYQFALDRFKNHPNIMPVLGDSALMLPQVLEKIDERTLFFLDGHYTFIPAANFPGYNNLKSTIGETPIVQELEAIAKHSIKNHIIIIDDCGCFANPDHKDYPSVEEMKNLCGRLFPNHLFVVKYGSIYLTPEEVGIYKKLS